MWFGLRSHKVSNPQMSICGLLDESMDCLYYSWDAVKFPTLLYSLFTYLSLLDHREFEASNLEISAASIDAAHSKLLKFFDKAIAESTVVTDP